MKKFEPNLPAVPETIRVASQAPVLDFEYEPQPAHVPLAHYLWILRRHGWRIAGFVAGTVLATLIVSLRLTPIYESTVTVDIDRQMPTGVLGQEALQNATNDADQFLATQVKLIQSDSVLRPVVDKFRLREVEKDALEEAIDKSTTSLEAPVILKNLKVTRPPNTYLLLISYRSQNRQLAADVANEIAQSVSAAYLPDPLQSHGEPQRLHGAPARGAEGADGKIERGLEPLRARTERDQSGGEDQYHLRAPAAVERGVHQGAGRSGQERSRLQLGERRHARRRAGFHARRSAEKAHRKSQRSPGEIRGSQEPLRRQPSRIQES